MRKKSWVLISLILIVSMLYTTTTHAAVINEELISPCYDYTNSISAGLSISDTGVAWCYGEIVVYELNNEIDLSVRLQRKEGNVWVLVKKWTASVDGDRDLYIDKTYTVTEGTYRVIATGLVTAPDGDIETCSCTTSQRTYP